MPIAASYVVAALGLASWIACGVSAALLTNKMMTAIKRAGWTDLSRGPSHFATISRMLKMYRGQYPRSNAPQAFLATAYFGLASMFVVFVFGIVPLASRLPP